MTTNKNAWTMIMNNVDYRQALYLHQGFGFAYTFSNKRKREE